MAKKKEPIKAKVIYTTDPKYAPTGVLTRCLFGMSARELAEVIALNKDGKWDNLYEKSEK